MDWFIIISFIVGFGSGVVWSRGRFRHGAGSNPFLQLDSTEADELREAGSLVVQTRIGKRKERIMEKAQADGRITNDGVEDMFCISDTTAGRYLSALVEEDKLVKVGDTGRGVYYEPR
ncbi:MAG: hypothetical protein WD605_02940 [Candidatus Paceibacterota bacterium]